MEGSESQNNIQLKIVNQVKGNNMFASISIDTSDSQEKIKKISVKDIAGNLLNEPEFVDLPLTILNSTTK
jgi:hypothetical protein